MLGASFVYAQQGSASANAAAARWEIAQAQPAQPHGKNPQNKPRPKPGEWLSKYHGMPLAEQEKELRNDPQFEKLPPQRQQALIQRLEKFNALPPQKQQQVIKRMQMFQKFTPQQRQQARQLQAQLKNVAPDRRKQMRIALRNLRQMPPQEQQQTLNSDQFKSQFNPDEINIMNGMLQLPIGAGAKKQK